MNAPTAQAHADAWCAPHVVRGDRMAVLLINDRQISLALCSCVLSRVAFHNYHNSRQWHITLTALTTEVNLHLVFSHFMSQFHLNVSFGSRNYRYIVLWRTKISLEWNFDGEKRRINSESLISFNLIPIPFDVGVFNNHEMHFDAAIIAMSKWLEVIPKLCINKMEMHLKASEGVWALHSSLTHTF